jgi:ABC-type transporter Mla subunit MlaD
VTWKIPTDAEKQAQKILKRLDQLEVLIMGVADEIKGKLARIEGAIGNLASDVRELVGRVPPEGGLTAAEAEDIRAEGERIATAAETAAGIHPAPVEPPPA